MHLFDIDIDNYIRADESTQPVMIDDSHQHFCLTETPLIVRVPRKSKNWDIVWVGLRDLKRNLFGRYIVISPHFQQLLSDHGITGYQLQDVDMRLGFEHVPADREFRQLVVTGWGGLPNEKSGVRRMESPRGKLCFSPCESPADLLDEDQWDGSDFFRIWPAGIFCTQRVADLVRDNNLKYVELTPIERADFGRPIDGKVGFIGKPLRVLYPESRAREIGQPLGIYW